MRPASASLKLDPMVSASQRAKLSFAIGLAAYVAGITVLVAVGLHVAWLAAAALLEGMPTPSGNAPRTQRPGAQEERSAVPAVVQGLMRTLADQWDGRGLYSAPSQRWRSTATSFGVRQRKPSRSDDDEAFAADDERPVTFRTVCVRLCDGYFFPISFAVGADRLEHDARVCEGRCGAQGRLFVHPNPGGSTDDLHDLSGRPYRQLRTAFLYRSAYIASCRCQPQPWDQAALDRHRAYALAAAAGTGNRAAARELQALEAKLKEGAKSAATPGQAAQSGEVWQSGTEAAARAAEVARREDGNYMGLGGGAGGDLGRPGGKGAPTGKAEAATPKSRPDQDWQHRIFDPSAAR
ncbi:MAG TPA: DUF2865 domain-containing protein [Hyphomicrobiaceae bacterium]